MKKLNWKEKAHLLEVLDDPKKSRKEFWDLIEELRKIENSQIFVISHNDRFIQKSKNKELYYINQAIKENKVLTPLDVKDFINAKEELGGLLYKLEYISSKARFLSW